MTTEECDLVAGMLKKGDRQICSMPDKKMKAIMCYAKRLQREGMDNKASMKEAWRRFKDICEGSGSHAPE